MSSQADPLSPESAPWSHGVKRLNQRPKLIIIGVIATFAVSLAAAAANRAEQQQAPAKADPASTGAADLKRRSSAAYARAMTSARQGGVIAAAKRFGPAPSNSTGSAPTEPDVQGPTAPVPPELQPPEEPGPSQGAIARKAEQLDQLEREKFERFKQAVSAKTRVDVDSPNPRALSAPSSTRDRLQAARRDLASLEGEAARLPPNAAEAYASELQQAQGTLGDGATDTPRSTNDVRNFDRRGAQDRWQLDSRVEAPRTPLVVQVGRVIDATLHSQINSELPGDIIGNVALDVRDSPTGRHVLIPQGTQLFGKYSSDVVYAQERLLVAWQRFQFPDGKTMDIGAMPGADALGTAGLSDQVDTHFFRIFASALMLSGVTAAVSLTQQHSTGRDQHTVGSAMAESLGQQMGQVSAQLIAKNMNVAPTLKIRPGFRFNVIVTKDIPFERPYRAYDWMQGDGSLNLPRR